MVDLAVHPAPAVVPERAARRQLREQIAALEAQLSDALITAFGGAALSTDVPAPGGPRVLTLGELETLRDALADRVAEARRELDARGAEQQAKRVALEKMLLEPGRHKFRRISQAELGEGGCGVWHVRPRLGLVGMLAGWWHVKLSSGCPLTTS